MLLGAGRTVSYLHLGRQAVLTADPENLKVMLAKNFQDFGLGDTRKDGLKPLFGSGIFNFDGQVWQVSWKSMPISSLSREPSLSCYPICDTFCKSTNVKI